MAVLVTGGHGYIGSHVCLALMAAGESYFVLDDHSSNSVTDFEECRISRDLADIDGLGRDFKTHGITEIIHLAGKKNVTESVANPSLYIQTNVGLTANILAAALHSSVETIIFSSSCSVYGERTLDRILNPQSPYAVSKRAAESIIHESANLGLIKSISLRYFNAAGASERYVIGERSDISLNLIPRIARAALNGEPFRMAAAREPTPDGTCIRDYIHVDDIALAHVAALKDSRIVSILSETFDIGSGIGTSTKDVLRAVENVTQRPIPYTMTPAREGDPTRAVAPLAPNARLPHLSSWEPSRGMEEIVATALRWHAHETARDPDTLPNLSDIDTW